MELSDVKTGSFRFITHNAIFVRPVLYFIKFVICREINDAKFKTCKNTESYLGVLPQVMGVR